MRIRSVMWRTLWTVFAVIAMIIGVIFVPYSTAQEAQDNSGKKIVLGDVRIAPVVHGEFKFHQTIEQWDNVAFEVDWSAPQGVFVGQEFAIEYPESFHHYATADFPLKGEGEEEFGTCASKPDDRKLVCRLDERAAALADRHEVTGTVTTQAQATKVLESREVALRFNGEERKIQLPGPADGNGAGVVSAQEMLPNELRKRGWYARDQVTGHWVINIPGRELVAWTRANNSVDVPVTDQLGGYNHVFTQPPSITEFKAAQLEDGNWFSKEKIGDPRLVKEFRTEDQQATFLLTPPEGGWNAENYYRVQYETKTHDGQFPPEKAATTNKASLLGKDVDAGDAMQRTQLSSATIRGVDKRAFEVRSAFADGTDLALVPPELQLKVKANILSPGAEGKEETLTLPAQGSSSFPTSLPEGTVVKLSAPTPQREGVRFGAPVFSVAPEDQSNVVERAEDGSTLTIRTVADRNVNVVLTYEASQSNAPFAVVKRTAGFDAARDTQYEFDYICEAHGEKREGTLTAKGDGIPVSTGDVRFPIGSKCVITEKQQHEGFDGYSTISEPRDRKRTITIAPEPNVVHAEFVTTFSRMNGSLGITNEITDPTVAAAKGSEEFHFEVSWSKAGIVETRTFTLRHGDVYTDFPKLPMGTKVTIKEKLDPESMWYTPQFKGSVGGAVEDHGDGSATATVLAEDAGMLVTVTNSGRATASGGDVSDAAGILGLLGLNALFGGGGEEPPRGGNAVATSVPRSPAEAEAMKQQQRATSVSENQNKHLARTGASVLGIVVLAIIVVGVGVWLVRRSRRK